MLKQQVTYLSNENTRKKSRMLWEHYLWQTFQLELIFIQTAILNFRGSILFAAIFARVMRSSQFGKHLVKIWSMLHPWWEKSANPILDWPSRLRGDFDPSYSAKQVFTGNLEECWFIQISDQDWQIWGWCPQFSKMKKINQVNAF